MIVEQIRYFVDSDDLESALEARREVTRVREQLGLPPGRVLIADPAPDSPSFVWQCGYEDEGEMGTVEATLIGNAEYEAARQKLASLVARVELEVYMPEDEA